MISEAHQIVRPQPRKREFMPSADFSPSPIASQRTQENISNSNYQRIRIGPQCSTPKQIKITVPRFTKRKRRMTVSALEISPKRINRCASSDQQLSKQFINKAKKFFDSQNKLNDQNAKKEEEELPKIIETQPKFQVCMSNGRRLSLR